MKLVQVPVAFILDPDLDATTKLLWMARRLCPDAGPAQLERLTGLSRHTVLRRVRELPDSSMAGQRIQMPDTLLAERSVGARAKVLYGHLQHLYGRSGWFTFAELATRTGIDASILRRAMNDLVAANWIRLKQRSRLRPIHFTLGSPALIRAFTRAALARRRLKRAEYRGEALMQEWLSLLIDSTYFTDNARPGFLINPFTDERLELDRFYPPGVAFEYHGGQHFQADKRYPQAKVDAQRKRDLIKAGLCLYEGIHLVIVQAADLSLDGMLKRIGTCMPLRDLTDQEPLIEMLEAESRRYRRVVASDSPR